MANLDRFINKIAQDGHAGCYDEYDVAMLSEISRILYDFTYLIASMEPDDIYENEDAAAALINQAIDICGKVENYSVVGLGEDGEEMEEIQS